jgi:hypothetical protein
VHLGLYLEYWSIGVMDLTIEKQTIMLRSSNTPSLQYAITPFGLGNGIE